MTKRQRLKRVFCPGEKTFEQRRTINPKTERSAAPESVLSRSTTAGLALLPLSSYTDKTLRHLAEGERRGVISSIGEKGGENRTASDAAYVSTVINGPNLDEGTFASRLGKAAYSVGALGISTGASILSGAGRVAYNYWTANPSKTDLSVSVSEKGAASMSASRATAGSLPADYATATLGRASTVDDRCAKLSSALPDYTPDAHRSFREEWTAHSTADYAWSQCTRDDDDDAVLEFCADQMKGMRRGYSKSLISDASKLVSAQPRVSGKSGSVSQWARDRESVTSALRMGIKGMKASSGIATGDWDEADMSLMSGVVDNASNLTQSTAYPSRKY